MDKVIWTDEVTFKFNKHINQHNSVYWADENLHEILCKEVNMPGITVWEVLISDVVLHHTPHFHRARMVPIVS